MQVLMKVENSIKAGYDPERDSWKPHASPEGGTDTIGYGHKLEQRDIDNGDIFINGAPHSLWNVPDAAIVALFAADVKEYELSAKKAWQMYRPQDALSWEWLPLKYRCVLTNVAYNVGFMGDKWPKLFDAIRREDDRAVREQMVTSYKRPDGTRVRLTKRAKQVADAVGLDQ
jgi:hypothetical protein